MDQLITIVLIVVLGLLFADCDGSTSTAASSIDPEALRNIIMFIITITIIVITLRFLIIKGIKYYKYKNETPEERQYREELENKMKEIREWSRRNKC